MWNVTILSPLFNTKLRFRATHNAHILLKILFSRWFAYRLGLLLVCLLLVFLTSLPPPRLQFDQAQLVSINVIRSVGRYSSSLYNAASLWLVSANDVLVSAAYKVNPILVSHSRRAGEQGWQRLREAWAGNGTHNAFYRNIKKYLDLTALLTETIQCPKTDVLFQLNCNNTYFFVHGSIFLKNLVDWVGFSF